MLAMAAEFGVQAAVLAALVAFGNLPPISIVLALDASGILCGLCMPARDMMVRAAAAPGQAGVVFGTVSTGFNIGGAVSPLLFGWLMDAGNP